MLVLSRKPGEKVCIGSDITLEVLDVKGCRVRIGLTAPNQVRIARAGFRPLQMVVVCGKTHDLRKCFMRLEIRSKGLEIDPLLRDAIKRRLQFALGRFGRRISHLTVDLAEQESPDRTEAKRCRIAVRLIGSRTFCVDETGAAVVDVVELATHRVGQLVHREIQRLREEDDAASTAKTRTI